MKLFVLTIALDALPWIACTFAELSRLTDIEWQWTIVEGAAMNVRDTRWCAKQEPRLSNDGTSEFLLAIASHPRVRIIQKRQWEGKVAMVNAACETFTEPGLLLQVDSDELWKCDQLRTLVHMFEDDTTIGSATFSCRYFVGPNIVTTDDADWSRAWRFVPGDRFVAHEPPIMQIGRGRREGRLWTKRLGLVFDHHSWTLPKHVAQKEQFYGHRYAGALAGWKHLQDHKTFPTPVKAFFPWSAPSTMVDKVFQ